MRRIIFLFITLVSVAAKWLIAPALAQDRVPGRTLSGATLQADTRRHIEMVAPTWPAWPKGCTESRVTDTRISSRPARAGQPWREQWTVLACGSTLRIDVEFSPAPDGGTLIKARAADGETQRKPAPVSQAAASDCNSKDPDKVIAGCTIAIAAEQSDQQRAIAYNNRGVAYRSKGEHERAIADFAAAIKLDPAYPTPYLNRAAVLILLGRREAAVADLSQAIRLKPDWTLAYLDRGRAYRDLATPDTERRKEWLEKAIKDLDHVLRLEPEHASALNERAFCHAIGGDHRRAIADFDRALRLEPQSLEALMGRGLSHAKLGSHQRALADLRQAVALPVTHEADRRNQELARKWLAEVTALAAQESSAGQGPTFTHDGKTFVLKDREPAQRTKRTEAEAEDETADASYMSGDEIIRALRGNSSDGTMSASGPYREYFAPDGQIRGKGFRGTWWVDADRLCCIYPGMKSNCFRVRKLGGSSVAWEVDGETVGTGRIVKGNPYKF